MGGDDVSKFCKFNRIIVKYFGLLFMVDGVILVSVELYQTLMKGDLLLLRSIIIVSAILIILLGDWLYKHSKTCLLGNRIR